MRIKNKKLEWNVLIYDFNSKRIRIYNIFYSDFIKELHKEIVIKKQIKNYEELRQYVDNWVKYRYWSRCEFEIHMGHFPRKLEELEKIDVYKQIEMNLDRILEYIINELKIEFKE